MSASTGSSKHATATRLSLCVVIKDLPAQDDVHSEDDGQGLDATLSGCRSIADDIIVVKVGEATNILTETASIYGATLLTVPQEDSLGAAYNLAVEKATGDWILMLEAGEVLGDGADLRRITETIKSAERPAYALTILFGEDPETGETTADGHCADPRGVLAGATVRLFRKGPEFRYDLAGEIQVPVSEQVGAADIHVHTPGFQRSSGGDETQSLELYTKSTELIDAGELSEAQKLLQEAYGLLTGPSPLGGSILRNLSFCLIHLQSSKAALKILQQATDAYPDFTDLFYLTGLAFYDLEEYLPALRNFEFCLTKGDAPSQYGGWDGIGSYRSQREMGEVFLCMEDVDRAEQYFRAALESKPSDGFSMEGLGEILLSKMEPTEAIAELEKVADFSAAEVVQSAADLFGRAGDKALAEEFKERLAALEGKN